MFPMPWNTRAQSGRSRLMPKLFGKICRIIEFQAGSCLYVTAAVQAGLTPQRGQSDQSFLRFVGKCLPEAQSDEFLPTYHCRFTASRSYFNPSHQCPELRKKECLPSGRPVCVCNPWNHRDPFGFAAPVFLHFRSYHSRGMPGISMVGIQRRHHGLPVI